jgi:dihydrofolate reductase
MENNFEQYSSYPHPTFNIFIASDTNYGIGKNGTLPWNIKEDLALFKKYTNGHVIIMGRKTWDSLPIKPLPGRINIVLSSKSKPSEYTSNNLFWLNNIDSSIFWNLLKYQHWVKHKSIYVIGGANIISSFWKYRQYCSKFLHHLVEHNFECDTIFPIDEWVNGYKCEILIEKNVIDHNTGNKYKYGQILFYNSTIGEPQDYIEIKLIDNRNNKTIIRNYIYEWKPNDKPNSISEFVKNINIKKYQNADIYIPNLQGNEEYIHINITDKK